MVKLCRERFGPSTKIQRSEGVDDTVIAVRVLVQHEVSRLAKHTSESIKHGVQYLRSVPLDICNGSHSIA